MSRFDRHPFDGHRRAFLRSTILGSLGLAAGGSQAFAWTLQPMNAATHRLYVDHCKADDGYHAALFRQAKAELQGRMDEKALMQKIAAMRCPICGCPILPPLDAAPSRGAAGTAKPQG